VRLFQKENLPLPQHFEKYIEFVRKQDHPTPEEINEREEKNRKYIMQLEKEKKEREEREILINKTKASSRLEKLKNKHSISGGETYVKPELANKTNLSTVEKELNFLINLRDKIINKDENN